MNRTVSDFVSDIVRFFGRSRTLLRNASDFQITVNPPKGFIFRGFKFPDSQASRFCSIEHFTHFPFMSAIRPPRIVRPGVLSNLKPSSIVSLLSPFADYFAARGASLDCLQSPQPDLDEIVSVLASPVESTPPDLIERLELLDLISDPHGGINFEDGYEALVKRLRDKDDSAEDLAVKILIHAPEIAWREFDR